MSEDRSHETALTGAAPVGNAPRAVRSGDVLGRYEIGGELGEGGMATVFRARDRELRRDVAVKVLFPHLARRPDVVRRFQREARAAAGLEHPNILRIYDVGGGEPAVARDAAPLTIYNSGGPADARDADPPYIVMELIRGRTLLQEIEQRGAMLAEIAACIGALLADALTAAHGAGIVHRDIKPSNVLIAPGGRLLLADFGVARLETEDSLVTRTGALLGTPAYMSPEQASGDIATAKSDLYSLGATLYQLATGALPYGGNAAKVMSALAAGPPVPPIRRRAAVGAALSTAIEQMMAPDPSARPANATAIATALREIAARGGLGDPTDELAAYFADPSAFLRAKTPVVAAALVRDARRALDENKLPRALALADRASALAPEDADVAALVDTVTEGGRAKRRLRAFVLAGAGIVLAGGATAGALALANGGERSAAPIVAVAAPDAAPDRHGDTAHQPDDKAIGAATPAPDQPDDKAIDAAPAITGDPASVASIDTAPARTGAPASAPPIEPAPARTGDPATVPPIDAAPTAVAPVTASPPRQRSRTTAPPIDAAPTAPSSRQRSRATAPPSDAAPTAVAPVTAPSSRQPRATAPPIDAVPRATAPSSRQRSQTTAPPPPSAAAAAQTPPVDAALPIEPAPDAAITHGTLHVENDTWCNLTIDNADHGRITRTKTLQLPAGPHTIACTQPTTGLGWTKQVDVRPDKPATIRASLIPDVDIIIATPGDRVTIDGVAATRGATLRLKAGQRHVAVFDGTKQLIAGWVAVPRAPTCRLRSIESGRLVCDP